jgi:hypothetical protein
MKLITRLAVLAGAAAAIAGLAVPAANASVKPNSSIDCVQNSGGFCGTLTWPLESAGQRVLSVPVAKTNAPAVIANQSDSSKQDITAVQENNLFGTGGPDKVFFIGTPFHPTGYCLADLTGATVLVARKCNAADGYEYQTFSPRALADGDVAWKGIATKLYILDGGNKGAGANVTLGVFNGQDAADITWKSTV